MPPVEPESGFLRLLDELAHLAADAIEAKRAQLAAIREQFKKDQAAIAAAKGTP